MKSKSMQISKLKYRLMEEKKKGSASIVLKLSPEFREYVERHYKMIPWEYEIFTIPRGKTFTKSGWQMRESKNHIINELYWASRRGESRIYRRLTPSDIKCLAENAIHFHAYTYKVFLR